LAKSVPITQSTKQIRYQVYCNSAQQSGESTSNVADAAVTFRQACGYLR